MQYTVSITHPHHAARTTCQHISEAVGFVQSIMGSRINVVHLVTDVATIGEYLECVGDVWVRVTKGTMH